jgi:hypothetical protein
MEEQLEERRKVGKNSCNSGDGTDQRVQSLMFMMMMMMMMMQVEKLTDMNSTWSSLCNTTGRA